MNISRTHTGAAVLAGIRQALKIADYVYVLEFGRNKFEGPASDFDDLEKALWVS